LGPIIAVGIVLIVLLVIVMSSVRIVREYERLVLFRLGRSLGTRGPGLVLIFPFIDRVVNVDLREMYLEIPHQAAITKDNATISIDFVIFHKVVDAVSSVLQVEDFAGAAQNVATTTLRAVVGDMSLDDVLAKRDMINEMLRAKLDEITERWGVKVTNVEIREVVPPPVVQEAMTRQMSAERTRRAQVTEAEGQRQATITVAEGDKQAQTLTAEGQRQAAILEAEGYAQALETVYAAASRIDAKTMGLQYLEALKALGASPSTKFVLPMEFANLLGGITGYNADAFRDASGRDASGRDASGDGA
jgi:regulator of protease activity HflC (stomatin/prohibitin superfamily)